MTNALAEIKYDNEIASDWLLYYPYRRRQYYEDLLDAENSRPVSEVNVKTGPGNQTMQKAIQKIELTQTEQWLQCVEDVENIFSEKKRIFLQVRREAAYMVKSVRGRPAWVLYVQRHYADRMAERYNTTPDKFWVSETTLKDWWHEMVEVMARVALKRGCLFIKKSFSSCF